jgi:hypothetical protein
MATRNARDNPNFNRKAPTGSFKRPNHNDFRTTDEHKKNKTTGVRKNDMALQWEFWILGEIKKTVSFKEVQADPQALKKAHMELFAFNMDERNIIT